MSYEVQPITVIQRIMRLHAFACTADVSLSRLDDLALQFGTKMAADDPDEAFAFGRTLFIYGVELFTITASMIEIQQAYLKNNEYERIIHAGQCCGAIIQGFVYEQLLHVTAAQEREIRFRCND